MIKSPNNNQSQPEKHHQNRRVVLSVVKIISVVVLLTGAVLLANQLWLLNNSQPIPVANIAGNQITTASNNFKPKPARIKIASLKIDAPVVDLGLNIDGTLEVPKRDNDVGWYTQSPTPGAMGPSVMVGHLDSARGTAIFYNLKNLKAGDQFQIVREDGSVANFKVDNSETYAQDNFPTAKVYGNLNYAGIRLITCSGTYSRIKGHYSDNLVVYGTLVSISPS
jgi:LPXTG-site transpeptidase (sortase) family protein